MAIPKTTELKIPRIYNLRLLAAIVDALVIAFLDCALMYFVWLAGMSQGILDADVQHWEQIMYCSFLFVLDGFLNFVVPVSGIYLNFLEAFPLKTNGLANWFLLACFIANWFYHAVFESSDYRATLGQSLVGLVVVNHSDGKIDFATASVRHLTKLFGALMLGIGLLPIWGSQRVPLHDWISKSTIKIDN